MVHDIRSRGCYSHMDYPLVLITVALPQPLASDYELTEFSENWDFHINSLLGCEDTITTVNRPNGTFQRQASLAY